MEKNKTLFDIIGPIIIGPSSSHTAGAVRIGYLAGKIFGQTPQKIKFVLYNSFAKTGKGHGTDKGLLGGALGFDVDDDRIKVAFKIADEMNIKYEFEYLNNAARHPNSVDIIFKLNDEEMTISGSSLGAGEVKISAINGFEFNINGDYNTLILIYKDKPGMVYRVSALLQGYNLNIASMHCARNSKGGIASMGICLDSVIPAGALKKLDDIEEIYVIRNLETLKK